MLFRSVYPGIDLVYHGNQRQLEYDFRLAPGARPAVIEMEFGGADSLRIDEHGDLVISTGVSSIRHQHPLAYQEQSGVRLPVEAAFVIRAKQRVGFEIGEYDRSLPLVIDPTLLYSTFFGGSAVGTAGDQGNAIALDSGGNAYITGFTTSLDFEAGFTRGPRGSGMDAYVMKVSPDGGTLLAATYIGGSAGDEGHDIALDSKGNVYITG